MINWQLANTQASTKRIDAFISETNAENRAHLEIGFLRRVRCLREGCNSYKPVSMANCNIWTNEDISDFLLVLPFGKNKLVQQFNPHRDSR